MKKGLLLLFFIPCLQSLLAQNGVGAGTTSPHSSASLDISSNNKGFLLPRMSQSARMAIVNPANGLLVYDSTQHRLYQFREGTWKYMMTNESWLRSAVYNRTYNSSDSVGIGISSPSQKLDVGGNIRSRQNVRASENIVAGRNIGTSSLISTGNLSVSGNIATDGNMTTYGDINLDNTGASLQLQNSDVKKAYFQLSGNDLRMGTNSGNSAGKLIIRINGSDAVGIDRFANIDMLQDNISQGNVSIGWKLCRFAAPNINMLPVMFGRVPESGGIAGGWVSPYLFSEWERVSTGRYEIRNDLLKVVSPYSAIIVTPAEPNRLCTATYISPGRFRVDIFNRTGTRVDCAFTFLVSDPLN